MTPVKSGRLAKARIANLKSRSTAWIIANLGLLGGSGKEQLPTRRSGSRGIDMSTRGTDYRPKQQPPQYTSDWRFAVHVQARVKQRQ
jgi:hypothetical protein